MGKPTRKHLTPEELQNTEFFRGVLWQTVQGIREDLDGHLAGRCSKCMCRVSTIALWAVVLAILAVLSTVFPAQSLGGQVLDNIVDVVRPRGISGS